MKGRDEVTPAKPQTASFDNAADTQTLEAVQTALAAGEDPFGDNDTEDTPAAAPTPADPPSAPPEASDADAEDGADEAPNLDQPDAAPAAPATAVLTPEQIEAAAAPAPAPAAPAPAPAAPVTPPLSFKTRTPAQLAADQSALLTKKAEAFQKYSEGTMTSEAYSAIDMEVMQGFSQVTAELALQQASSQTAMQVQEQAIEGVKVLAAQQGHLDYDKDPQAVAQFDAAIEALAKDPAMRALPNAAFYEKAHGMVLFMRGITPGTPPPAPPPAPTPAVARQDLKPPITLRGVPAAATPNAGGGMAEQMSRAQGLEFEELVSAIPRAARDAWMDS